MKEKALHSKEAMRGRNTCLQVLDVNWPAEMAAERQNQKPMEGAQSYLTSENFSVKKTVPLFQLIFSQTHLTENLSSSRIVIKFCQGLNFHL